ncbi:MAG: hypothetical protein J6U64_03265, partial [Alphaproteobacteria bacterium]|nr:hypothetical protein [Alphaproteobacteria bacterium]
GHAWKISKETGLLVCCGGEGTVMCGSYCCPTRPTLNTCEQTSEGVCAIKENPHDELGLYLPEATCCGLGEERCIIREGSKKIGEEGYVGATCCTESEGCEPEYGCCPKVDGVYPPVLTEDDRNNCQKIISLVYDPNNEGIFYTNDLYMGGCKIKVNECDIKTELHKDTDKVEYTCCAGKCIDTSTVSLKTVTAKGSGNFMCCEQYKNYKGETVDSEAYEMKFDLSSCAITDNEKENFKEQAEFICEDVGGILTVDETTQCVIVPEASESDYLPRKSYNKTLTSLKATCRSEGGCCQGQVYMGPYVNDYVADNFVYWIDTYSCKDVTAVGGVLFSPAATTKIGTVPGPYRCCLDTVTEDRPYGQSVSSYEFEDTVGKHTAEYCCPRYKNEAGDVLEQTAYWNGFNVQCCKGTVYKTYNGTYNCCEGATEDDPTEAVVSIYDDDPNSEVKSCCPLYEEDGEKKAPTAYYGYDAWGTNEKGESIPTHKSPRCCNGEAYAYHYRSDTGVKQYSCCGKGYVKVDAEDVYNSGEYGAPSDACCIINDWYNGADTVSGYGENPTAYWIGTSAQCCRGTPYEYTSGGTTETRCCAEGQDVVSVAGAPNGEKNCCPKYEDENGVMQTGKAYWVNNDRGGLPACCYGDLWDNGDGTYACDWCNPSSKKSCVEEGLICTHGVEFMKSMTMDDVQTGAKFWNSGKCCPTTLAYKTAYHAGGYEVRCCPSDAHHAVGSYYSKTKGGSSYVGSTDSHCCFGSEKP